MRVCVTAPTLQALRTLSGYTFYSSETSSSDSVPSGYVPPPPPRKNVGSDVPWTTSGQSWSASSVSGHAHFSTCAELKLIVCSLGPSPPCVGL